MSGAGKVGWMVVRTVSTVVAVTLTKKAMDSGWRFVTGKEPPEKKPAADSDARLSETLIWVGASAVGIAAAQLLAGRIAANRWQAWTGELPPAGKSKDSGAGDSKDKVVKAIESKARNTKVKAKDKAKRARTKARKLKRAAIKA